MQKLLFFTTIIITIISCKKEESSYCWQCDRYILEERDGIMITDEFAGTNIYWATKSYVESLMKRTVHDGMRREFQDDNGVYHIIYTGSTARNCKRIDLPCEKCYGITYSKK